MLVNKLKINDGKTEFMVISNGRLPYDLSVPDLEVGDTTIQPCKSLRNLGSFWDNHMLMDVHIKNCSKTCYFQLHNISQIKKFLNFSTLETLIHSFITSRLDYANALLYGIPQKLIKQLQLMQNNAARLLTGTNRQSHITPVLKQLHWLPVSYRIQYKVILTVYKCLNKLAPPYLQELINIKDTGRNLRSQGTYFLVVPKSRTVTYGDRSFRVAGPTLWNSLPPAMRTIGCIDTFKTQLKTFLFNKAFN